MHEQGFFFIFVVVYFPTKRVIGIVSEFDLLVMIPFVTMVIVTIIFRSESADWDNVSDNTLLMHIAISPATILCELHPIIHMHLEMMKRNCWCHCRWQNTCI